MSDPQVFPIKKIKPPSPHKQIRIATFRRSEAATKRTDVRHYDEHGNPLCGNTWHKGLFNPRIRRIVAKHAKHRPKYRVNVPSDAVMFNARHYTLGQGLARFE